MPRARVARQWADDAHNGQPGDPVKAVAAMVKITEVSDPPLRLQLGAECVNAITAKLAQVKEELDRYRALAESTAFEG